MLTRLAKRKIHADILSWIDFDGLGYPDEIAAGAPLESLFKCYRAEYHGTLSEWLSGLPSCIRIPFSYYDIEKTARDWFGELSEDELEKICEKWFSLIASELQQMKAQK